MSRNKLQTHGMGHLILTKECKKYVWADVAGAWQQQQMRSATARSAVKVSVSVKKGQGTVDRCAHVVSTPQLLLNNMLSGTRRVFCITLPEMQRTRKGRLDASGICSSWLNSVQVINREVSLSRTEADVPDDR